MGQSRSEFTRRYANAVEKEDDLGQDNTGSVGPAHRGPLAWTEVVGKLDDFIMLLHVKYLLSYHTLKNTIIGG